ncbi:MAG: type II toxin-antitoxin system VapC family toxin [Saccharolobus sp.]|jgi:predicted nucleic acid-binding protein|uniref:type II toxin-antitoxin system VapC family toxin n=1 Tax=Saccharolobus sp. TaxID=2100761 RepID=UPI0028CED6AF|nr:type II toxin-antitoxin system VapC family toxin [Saccharolobus sp.]MDT7862742.1 type II toxin-antitoxin system VapC family toxin [Saccharolobus sp.]
MSYVFDSSSIYKAFLFNKLSILGGNYTVILSKFELGNVIWKEVTIFKRITKDEGEKLYQFLLKVLETMNLEDVNYDEVEKIAIKNGISFYDASYVWLARNLSLPLITEDEKLRKKAGGFVSVMSLEEIK